MLSSVIKPQEIQEIHERSWEKCSFVDWVQSHLKISKS